MVAYEKAYAKINLFLDVTSRRADGFHDILSVMHTVSLCDDIELSAEIDDKISINISCDDPSLPTDEGNIVYTAVLKFLSFYNIYAKVNIRITKRIPIGAGLGGGSADAAATLRALSRVFEKRDYAALREMASELGSDVPFCLRGGICLCTGRGEKLEPIDSADVSSYVIAIGSSRVSTPKAYAALDDKYDNFLPQRDKKPLLNANNPTPYNIFEEVTNFDEIAKIKEIMQKSGAEYTLMSGSGPSVFGRFENDEKAEGACLALREACFTAFSCISVYPEVSL